MYCLIEADLWVGDRQARHPSCKGDKILLELEPQLWELVTVYWKAAPSQTLPAGSYTLNAYVAGPI